MASTNAIHRTCRLCSMPFDIVPAERAYLEAVAAKRMAAGDWQSFVLPTTCVPCRAFRRREKFAAVADGVNEVITCTTCRETFVWTAGEKAFYQRRHYAKPRRCPRCRPLRNAPNVSGQPWCRS